MSNTINLTKYEKYLERMQKREDDISRRINDISDPLQAIEGIREHEGSTLNTMWESDSGHPIDGTMFLIVMLPVLLGIIGHYVASHWEPMPTGEELYDDFGNRIVEYPRAPIAYLQQTRKDLSATRENRNSLAWLCHKWIISTNDVVQELQAPYPLEQPTLRTVPERKGTGQMISRMYEKLQQAALEYRIQQKKLKKDDLRKKLDLRKRSRPLHTLPFRMIFRKAPDSDVLYLKRRLVKAKRLWNKLNQWIEEYSNADENTKSQISDDKDSYWSSSETFSSDSGEHWKSYREDAQRWLRGMKITAQWKLEKGRKLQDAALAAEERRRKQAEAATLSAALAAVTGFIDKDDDKSKSGRGSSDKRSSTPSKIHSQNTSSSKTKSSSKSGEKPPPLPTVDKVSYKSEAGGSKTKSSERVKKQLSEASKIGDKKPGKR